MALSAPGQSIAVVPPSAALAAGTTGNSIPLGNFSTGTYQCVYGAEQMSGIPVGSVITGIQLRQWNDAQANFPSAALAVSRYDIRFAATTKTPATMSGTFAENMVNPVLVRSGSFNLAAGAYPGGAATGSTPEGWGPVIAFTTPFAYLGGGLAVEFREDSPTGLPSSFADISTVVGVGAQATSGSSNATETSTSVSQNRALVMRLTFTTPVERFQSGITRLMILDDLANVRGNSSNVVPLNTDARTNQYVAAESELRRLGRGSRLVGMFYRNATGAAWPLAAETFTKYDIQLSRALTTPGTMSSTILDNVGTDATAVRSGLLAIPAGAFVGLGPSPRPAPWTLEIPFATPYMYSGGGLMTLVRHDGTTVGGSGSVAGTLTSDAAFGTRVKGRVATGTSMAASTTTDLSYSAQLWSVDSGTVAPGTLIGTRGDNAAHNSTFASIPNALQHMIHASELSHIPIGSQITGFTMRSRQAGDGPTSSSAFADYEVYVSTAATTLAGMSATFATNEGADKVQVRDGAMSIGANSFKGSATVSPFGPTVQFERAFIYKGGDLCITVRHSGSNGSSVVLLDAHTAISKTRINTTTTSMNAATGIVRDYGGVVRVEYNPSVIAPSAKTSVPGETGYSVMLSAGGNVLQGVYAEDQLRGLRIGSLITGMSLRNQSRFAGFADWPTSNTVVNRFDVTLSTSPVVPQSMSDTFASNIGADAILVRSGSMTIPARAFPCLASNTRPNENEWFIQFTEPFVYKGGPLSVTIRNDSGAGGGNFYADAHTASSAIAAGRWSFGAGADALVHDNGTLKGALILRFAFVPKSYCPADLNNDGIVEDEDFTLFLSGYNTLDCADSGMAFGCPADFNFDGAVNDGDFEVFIGAYNELVCP